MSKNNGYRYCRIISLILVIVISVIIFPSIVSADAGPKPSLVINAVNMPDKLCYMDLLVEVDNKGEIDSEYLKDDYNQDMIKKLSSYYEGGWSAAVVNREYIIFNSIECRVEDGNCTKNFGYMLPDRFRIIVVTEDGNIKTSNVIKKRAFNSTMDFDYSTGELVERSVLSSFLPSFIITLLITLLVEGLLFLLFKFGIKKYWGLVLGVNVVTQIFLYAAILFGTVTGGFFFAIILYILAEILIFIGETIIYAFMLKSRSIGYRIGYALSANIASLIAGIIFFAIII